MTRTRMLALGATLLCAAGLAGPATAGAAELLYGVDTNNRLISFSSDRPTSITRLAITGLQPGEQLVGLDRRPANGEMVGLGSTSRIYRLTVATGAATPVGAPFAPALSGTSFGWDFNPTVDRIRLTSDSRQNLRLNPDTGAVAAVDGPLAYAAGDAGAGITPRIVGSAYTNSVAGATTTQLYNLDTARNALVLQNPPNNGTLVTVGLLGVDIGDNAGFDIAATDGAAYAAVHAATGSTPQLHRIDLATGRATLVGRIGGGTLVRALAAAGTAPADTAAPGLTVAQLRSAKLRSLLRVGLRLRVTCSEGCTLAARVVAGRRVVGMARAVTTDLAGSTGLRVVFRSAAKKQLASVRRVRLTVVVTATDAAGNATTLRRSLTASR